MTYLLDANVFIDAKRRYYAFDVCPGFWTWLDGRYQDGTVRSVEAVKDELTAWGDDLSDWVEAHAGMFQPVDTATLTSLAALSTWANTQQYRPAAIATFLDAADYYLIGYAHAHGLTVVTHERPSNEITRIKIPNACVAMGVPYASPWQMLRASHATFVLTRPQPPMQERLL